jgi:hypothetical protein
LVDVLDRPDLSGGWEEIWRSLETIEYFDLDEIVAYARLLDNATTIWNRCASSGLSILPIWNGAGRAAAASSRPGI